MGFEEHKLEDKVQNKLTEGELSILTLYFRSNPKEAREIISKISKSVKGDSKQTKMTEAEKETARLERIDKLIKESNGRGFF